MLSPYTTTEQVRALLGVSDEELTDETLNLPVYEHGLQFELQKVSEGLPALFTTLKDKPQLSSAEDRLVKSVEYYCAIEGAVQAGSSLALVAPKRMTDDKSGFERFSDSPYRDVLERLQLKLIGARGALIRALESLTGATISEPVSVATQFVAVKRGYDPVTGEGASA